MDFSNLLRWAWEQILLAKLPSNDKFMKEQAIEEDKGADLIERLGKIDALHCKEEQRIKTAQFVEQFATIRKSEELKVEIC